VQVDSGEGAAGAAVGGPGVEAGVSARPTPHPVQT